MQNKYDNELDFEHDLVELLVRHKGWRDGVINHPTEQDLIDNWAKILYANNRSIDRLGNYPLTKTEMDQILAQINEYRTPFNLNTFINGGTLSIKRDNPDDKEHLGKTVYLKIYDRNEIAGGDSTYQIAEQPVFSKKSQCYPDRRGDIMLLINGMPLIHVELKRSGVPVAQAQNQIQKYSEEGIFSGLFSLVQVFVAMTPEEMTYFANPGPDGRFNKRFYFHWEDFNNEIISDWQEIADQFLSIPMAHQLIGFYTVADHTDDTLKVLRSYQYYAANQISDTVSKVNKQYRTEDGSWDLGGKPRGGYIWHTTGSGKTLTSFKAAQLIANSGDADKVVFLVDRIELGTQSLDEYKNFSVIGGEEIQDTENTDVLRGKLKSNSVEDTLIVTSIQKMSRLKVDDPRIQSDLAAIRKKRLVIIIDECHRSVFGTMLQSIRDAFPNALLFGFTGTPIDKENEKKGNTTSSIFGDELHRYSIRDGIRDHNVLGFDTYKVETFSPEDLRLQVALDKAKAKDEAEAISDPAKKKVFYHYREEADIIEVEEEVPISQYNSEKHRRAVCENILKEWIAVSRNYKYHAILATSSIQEACDYYRLLKKMMSEEGYPLLNITALFDPNTDNNGQDIFKERAIAEMLEDYNDLYGTDYTIPTYQQFKKDVAKQLAHKALYRTVRHENGDTLDLLIVVNQMLTGFDSMWINALHLDKLLEYENIVQAFSRTNRLNDTDKRAGLIFYYRYPNIMEANVKEAFRVYSGDKPFGIFVDKLEANIQRMNFYYREIEDIFKSNGIQDFSKNPSNDPDIAKFVLAFNELSYTIESAKVQGFRWDKHTYEFKHDDGGVSTESLIFDKSTFDILTMRYRELLPSTMPSGATAIQVPPYDIDPSLITTSADKINYDYMEQNFTKYLREIQLYGCDGESARQVLDVLRRYFSSLSQEDQKLANIIIHDIQNGELRVDKDEKFIDILNRYRSNKRDKAITAFCQKWFLPEGKFREFAAHYSSLSTINEFGKKTELEKACDKQKLIERLSAERGERVRPLDATLALSDAIIDFMVSGCMGDTDSETD